MKISGYSKQQMTRLIKQYRKTGYIKHYHANEPFFKKKYTAGDVRLVANMAVVEGYDTPCGHDVSNSSLVQRGMSLNKSCISNGK